MPIWLRLAAFASTMVMVFALSAALSVSVAWAAWSIQTTTPAPPKESATYLYDVSCEPSTELCTAVGRSSKSGVDSPLALRRNGISWSEQTAAKKSGSTHNRLLGVDCPSETRCIAVGNYQSSEGGPATLGELWNEGKWSVQSTPVPSEATSSELVAVGCNSTASCRAAGSAVIGGVKTAIIEAWASPTWTLQTVPIPEGATSSQLDGIDCIWSNVCVAVGRYTVGGSVKKLAMLWNGTNWSLQTLADPEGAVQSTLLDVSCTKSPTRCTAVGSWKNGAGEQFTLAYRFNGSTWTLQSTSNPSGATESFFQDVSCATETSCTAVGGWVSSGGSTKTLAEVWNGSSWSLDSTPNPPGEAFNSLFGVSCGASMCLGVGWSLNTENPAMALVSPAANTFRFVHDADGRLKAVIEPEGEAAFYSWDAAGNLTSISRGPSSKLSITELSPVKGEVGDPIKIKGTGFSSTPASNTVKFNGTAATVEAATPWALTVKVPVGATSGAVTVATGGEPVTSPENFTVAASGKPSISSLSPTVAASGEEVTISGSNFEPLVPDNAIAVNGYKPEAVSASTTALKFKVPAEHLGGKVSVATYRGSVIGPDLFIPPPGTAASKVGTTARFSLGESKTVSLVGSEKVALILFDGTAGERVSILSSENTFSGALSLWSPSGSVLASSGFGTLVGPVTLPATGTYTIRAAPSSAATGSLKIATYGFQDQTGTIDPPATAEGLKQPVSLTVPGKRARFSVDVKAGDRFAVRASNTNFTSHYTTLEWREPNGSLSHYFGLWSNETYFWNPKTSSTAGTWTLIVDPEGAITGSTDLTVWETPDLTSQSITPSAEGASVTSTIGIPGQRELISFSGTEGQQVSWKATESTISAGGIISILKPDGSELSGSSGSFAFHEPVTLPTTGTYKFVVDPAATGANPATNGTGSIKLTAYTVQDQTGTIDPPATAEGLKQPVSLTAPGKNARFSVDVKAGDRFAIRASSTNFTGSFVTLKWINPSGSLSHYSGLSSNQTYFWDPKAHSPAGTWTLEVDPEGAITGSTDLTIWETPDVTSQSITPSAEGGSVTSTISIPGQRELVSFSGTAGQQVSWKATESTISAGGIISILKPDGSELSGSSGGFSYHEPVTLPTTGTYKFVVDPAATGANPATNGTGSIKLTAYTVQDQTGTIDPPATAEGLIQSVSLPTPGKTARFSVEVKAGDKFALRTSNTNFTAGYTMKWLNPSGSWVHSNSFGAKQNYLWDTKTLSTTGTWMLLVDPEGEATGSTDLTIWETPDITSQSITPSTEGASVTSTINIPGQRELVSFSGTAGQKIAWQTSESTFAGGTISILKPDGSELSGSSGSFVFHEPVTLPTTGTYKFVIDPVATAGDPIAGGLGSIKLTAYTFEDATATIDPPATAEGLKQPVSLSTPGQTARLSVEAKAGDTFSLRTTNPNFTGQFYVRWLNPSGSIVHSALLGAKQDYFWDPKTLSTAGTWTLLVDPYETSTGSVDLLVWETPDITGQSITPSTEGGSVTSTINAPGQRELITFSGTASQPITLKAQESTISSSSMWLLKPDGNQLSGSEVSFSSGSSGKKELTLPTTGTYKIVVDPVSNATGSAKVIVYLGSHAAWPGVRSSEPRLARLSSHDRWGGENAYSDIPAGKRASSASDPSDAKVGRKGSGPQSRRLSPRKKPRLSASSLRRSWQPPQRAGWLPPKPEEERNWLVGPSSSPWLDLPSLDATGDTTALAGQVLRVDGRPLGGLSVLIEGADVRTETGRGGRFLMEDLPAGHQVLVVHGDSGDRRFGTYEIGVDLKAGETTVLDYTIWLTPLDSAGDLEIALPTKHEASLRTPRVPGLEVKMPAGTEIVGDGGRPVKDLNITAIPLDRPPFPLPPFVTVPVYFTVQPGGATLTKGARFVYPNWGELAPGERVDFWNYDPEDRGWYVYGRGTVTPGGDQVVPDAGVRVWEFTGAMAVSGPTPPTEEPKPEPKKGDPVDLYTGLFTYDHTDLVLPDTIPIAINRTYRTKDSNSYSFGIGMTNAYDLRLWPVVDYKEADLILPDGARVHYVRTSPGTGWTGAVYEPTGEAGGFDGSTLSFTESSTWDLKLRDGSTLTFGGFSPLIAIKDSAGNTLTIKRTGGAFGNIKEVISPNGRWAKFTYDPWNKITEIVDNGGRKLKYTYTNSHLTKVEAPGGRTTEYEYDGSWRMKAVINPRGNKFLQNEYDANGRVKKQVSGDGGTFEFAYELDEAGKVKATTTTDPLGNQDKVAFNSEGLWTSETEAPGTELAQTTSFERQAGTGLLLSETDPLGRKTAFEYDSNGNVKEVTQMAGTAEAETTKFAYEPGTSWITEETDPLGHTSKYQYGTKGQLLKQTDALGNETTFVYSAAGQPTEVTNAEGETTKFSYDGGDLVGVTNPLGHTTSRFIDALGRLRATTLPGGERYLYAYNEADKVTSVTTPLGAKTTIEYDADGNPTAIIDPRSGKTTMTYDSMDRLTKETDPVEKTAEWTYSKAGDLVESIDRRGKVSKLSYDELRRLTGASFGVSGETSESSISYQYDNADRLTEIIDSAAGEYALGYDNFDRLTSVEGPNGNVGYEYDDAGRRTLMEVPGGSVEYEYDDANRLTDLASGEQTVSLDYDEAGRLESLTLPTGIEQLYGYDNAGHVTSIDYKDGESTLGEIDYAYDVNGRTEAMWGSYARLSLPEPLKSTKYNAANQLIEREGKSLTYDADGNLTKDGSNEYTWNARGQLTGISGANTASFGYDPFGRRSSKTLGGTTTKLLYDGANVVQESVGESVTADMLTGLAPDQLFSRTTEAGTSSYLTDRLGSAIALANGSGEVKTSYTYDPFGSMSKTGEATGNPYQFTGRENDDTGLMYYRARYYSPLMGRFISQDPAGFVDGANLYEYVDGAPLDFTDPTGEMAAQSAGCCRNAWDKVVKVRDKVAEWHKILDDLGKSNNLDDLDEWIEEKIGDWAGCGDEVSSGEDNWKDILKGGLKGAWKGRSRGLPGVVTGGGWGALKGDLKRRLKRFVVCDRLG